MDIILSFFRDTLSGWIYLIYVIICLIFILAIIGVLGEKKKNEIREQIKLKRKQDLLSGEAAARASLEGKQIINVISDTQPKVQPATPSVTEVVNPLTPPAVPLPIIDAPENNIQTNNGETNSEEEKVKPLVINGNTLNN